MNKKMLKEYTGISLGAFMIAAAISVFFEPNEMVTGGATGLAIVIANLGAQAGFDLSLGMLNLLINAPLFLIGFKLFGIKFLAKTLYATFFLSFCLFFTEKLPTIESDLILIAIFGGVLSGAGIGLVFRSFATTGGTDLAASILHKFFKHYQISTLMLLIDSVIVLTGLFVFGMMQMMYAVIAIFVTSRTISVMLEGLSFAKAVFIISDHSDEIGKKILEKLDRGATVLTGKGMYTQKDKSVILCVVSRKEMIKLKELSHHVDPNSFLIVTDVREVFGEGFLSVS